MNYGIGSLSQAASRFQSKQIGSSSVSPCTGADAGALLSPSPPPAARSRLRLRGVLCTGTWQMEPSGETCTSPESAGAVCSTHATQESTRSLLGLASLLQMGQVHLVRVLGQMGQVHLIVRV